MKTKNKVFGDTNFTILLLIKTNLHAASSSGSACGKFACCKYNQLDCGSHDCVVHTFWQYRLKTFCKLVMNF